MLALSGVLAHLNMRCGRCHQSFVITGSRQSMVDRPILIDIVENANANRHYRTRNIPFRRRESFETQLNNMEEQGIIEKAPTGESFTRGHVLVVVPKKGSTKPRITVALSGIRFYFWQESISSDFFLNEDVRDKKYCKIRQKGALSNHGGGVGSLKNELLARVDARDLVKLIVAPVMLTSVSDTMPLS